MLIGWQKRNVKAGDKLKEKQQYVGALVTRSASSVL